MSLRYLPWKYGSGSRKFERVLSHECTETVLLTDIPQAGMKIDEGG
jgi:hypothetical protein